MSIARTLQDYLAQEQIAYEVVTHLHTLTSMETAAAAHVPGDRLAKAVVLEDDQGYVMAVIPSTYHVELGVLGRQLHRQNLRLAVEPQLRGLFEDCELGAVPPVGAVYGLPTVVEEDLAAQPEVFFEAGDHQQLFHLSQAEFVRLMTAAHADQRHFSHHI
jgi:Ala-tRNA(Pro) deacylase